MISPVSPRTRLFGLGSWDEARRVAEILRSETVGGALLVVAAVFAIVLANSPAAPAYLALRDLRVGPASMHLDLTLATWAADGLLAIFFFLVGLELKHEFVAGDLRDPRRALVPVVAAVGGVAVPALIYALINLRSPTLLRGWAIPTATDIAFAVAVLAVIGSHLPGALRTFLLTLAVVDDLIAIVIIAVFYTSHIEWAALAGAALPIGLYAFLAHRFRRLLGRRRLAGWVILVPLGVLAWGLMHASGLHATIAGVALGLCVPVKRLAGDPDAPGLARILEHRIRPLSAGVAVPIFAFLSAGVSIGGLDGIRAALTDPVTLGIVAGLVLGKPIGIVLTTLGVTRLTRAELDESVAWIDLVGVGVLAGIGFTVSLLVSELSFAGTPMEAHAKIGVLVASVLAAGVASGILVTRNRAYRAIEDAESADSDGDGIPDAYQRP